MTSLDIEPPDDIGNSFIAMASRTSIVDAWYDAMENRSDPRTTDWFMIGSLLPTLLVILVYVYFVKILGPKLMEKRTPFDLNNIMLAYNFIQVFISAYLFYEFLAAGWFGKYSFRCQPVDYSDSPDGLRMARACYLYYLSKFPELVDTIFFVLRKKNKQISVLHVVHHSLTPTSVWFGVKFVPGGHGTLLGLLNTFVHIWMYMYYFLAALGPRVQPYLWWKRYLTTLQMIQFVILLVHSLQMLFIECNYPMVAIYTMIAHAAFFLYMFKDFYSKAYKPKEVKKRN